MIGSLGGGTPCYFDNIDYINGYNNTKTLYLKTSVESLSRRLINKKNKRPLISHLKNIDDIKHFIIKHLFERSQFYSKAKFKISTDNKKLEKIITEIKTYLT